MTERYNQRHKKVKLILDALWGWAQSRNAVPQSAFGKAIRYLLEQWSYLEDGRLVISNNCAERSIKLFVIDRKSFLFANTPGGTHGSASIFSMIETAKENRINPYKYLLHILQTAPAMVLKQDV